MRELAVNNLLASLPEIPRKRYFAIGEVSGLCAVKPHVLRYWEQEFPQLKPVKRRGNRRYYQHDDVQMIRSIRSLLYEQGFTIGGARASVCVNCQKYRPKSARRCRPRNCRRRWRSRGKFSKTELRQMRTELEAALKLLDR